MTYQRTQIMLDPEEHRRLIAEAAERGISLAEYLRRIIASRTSESAVPYAMRSFEGLFNALDSGAKDTVEHMDEEAGAAFDEELRRSLTRRTRARPPASKAGPRRKGSRM